MKKIILLLALTGCTNCSDIKKPFVIYSKGGGDNSNIESYYYVDANGNQEVFYDTKGKYSVGDTIK